MRDGRGDGTVEGGGVQVTEQSGRLGCQRLIDVEGSRTLKQSRQQSDK